MDSDSSSFSSGLLGRYGAIAGRAAARLSALAPLVGLLLAYQVLSTRLAVGPIQSTLFYIAYALALAAAVLFFVRFPLALETVVSTARRRPVLFLVLLFNTGSGQKYAHLWA